MHIFSRELTKKTSKQYSRFLTDNILNELRELSTSLTDKLPYINEEKINNGLIESDFYEMCHNVRNIKNEFDNI